MLRLVQLEELQELLLRVPGLVDDFEQHTPGFPDAVKMWLTHVEQALQNNRLTAVSQVAALRAMLISVERGVVPPGLNFSTRATTRRIRDATAIDVLRKAEEILTTAVRMTTEQIAEGERLTRQIVAVACHKGLLDADFIRGDHSQRLRIWQRMTTDPDIGSATVHLAGLVGVQDAMTLFERRLSMEF